VDCDEFGGTFVERSAYKEVAWMARGDGIEEGET
jgi:hypothetical protein